MEKQQLKDKNAISSMQQKRVPDGDNFAEPSAIAQFHQTLGNQVVQAMLRSGAFRAKLSISRPEDPLELEAERAADKVMKMREPSMSSSNGESDVNPKGMPAPHSTDIGEASVNNETELEQGIQSLQTGGKALTDTEKVFFEPRFGMDLSAVRVHDDSVAAEMADNISAKAFAVGNDIVFGKGKHETGSNEGKHLMAHELAHVVQQRDNVQPRVARNPKKSGTKLYDISVHLLFDNNHACIMFIEADETKNRKIKSFQHFRGFSDAWVDEAHLIPLNDAVMSINTLIEEYANTLDERKKGAEGAVLERYVFLLKQLAISKEMVKELFTDRASGSGKSTRAEKKVEKENYLFDIGRYITERYAVISYSEDISFEGNPEVAKKYEDPKRKASTSIAPKAPPETKPSEETKNADTPSIAAETSIPVDQKIYFARNIDTHKSGQETVFVAIADVLKKYPHLKISIEGHASTEGNGDYNRKLSERRANTVKDTLLGKEYNVPASQLNMPIIGKGENEPAILHEKSEADRDLNRRVVVNFSGKTSMKSGDGVAVTPNLKLFDSPLQLRLAPELLHGFPSSGVILKYSPSKEPPILFIPEIPKMKELGDILKERFKEIDSLRTLCLGTVELKLDVDFRSKMLIIKGTY